MPTFTSISIDLPIRQDRCDLVDVSWRQRELVALFSCSTMDAHELQAVRVTFKDIILMRIVDEMVYSLEDRGKDIGITREGFAYKVTDSPFLLTLTEAPNLVHKNPPQYTFISLNTCLDVIATNPPQFDLIDLRPWLQEEAQNGNQKAIKWLADHPG